MEYSLEMNALFVALAFSFVKLVEVFILRLSKKEATGGCNTFTALDREALKRIDKSFGHKGMVTDLFIMCKDCFSNIETKQQTLYKTTKRIEDSLK